MTTMVATTKFFPLTKPYLAECSEMMVRFEVVRAAIQFCEETLIWKEHPPAVSVVADTHTYAIPSPAAPSPTQAQPAMIDEAYYKGTPLYPTTPYELQRWHSEWSTKVGTPTRYTQENPDTIRLVGIPQTEDAQVDGLTLLVSYKPTMDATQIPEFLYKQYGFAVAAGALMRLTAMKNRSWYDPQSYPEYASQFHKGIVAARIDATKAFSRAPRQVWRKFV